MNKKSIVCKTANQLVKEGYTRSQAFVKAWQMVNDDVQIYSSVKPAAVSSETDLVSKVKAYKELQKAIEELEAKASQVKESLIAELDEQHVEELQVDIFKVRYITVTSNRFDTTGFKKAHTELYSTYLKESTCKRFTIV